MNTPQINNVITWDINGSSFGFGYITEVRDKAIKIDAEIVGVSATNSKTVYTRSAWIPKSVVIEDSLGSFKIKPFFAKNGLKLNHIKKYMLNNDGTKYFI